jgi:hypothetical protein
VGRTAETATYFAGPGGLVKAGIEKGAGPGFKAAQKLTPAAIEALNRAKPAFTIKQAEGAPISSVIPGRVPKAEEGVSRELRRIRAPSVPAIYRAEEPWANQAMAAAQEARGPTVVGAAPGPFGIVYLDFEAMGGAKPTVMQIKEFLQEMGYSGAHTVKELRGGLSTFAKGTYRFRIDFDQLGGRFDSREFVERLGFGGTPRAPSLREGRPDNLLAEVLPKVDGGVLRKLRKSGALLSQEGQVERGIYSLHRIDDVAPSAEKPHGAFFSIEQPGFKSQFEGEGARVFRRTASPKSPLYVQPGSVQGFTFADDAAIRAISELKGGAFLDELKKMGGIGVTSDTLRGTAKGKEVLRKYLEKNYPGVEWGRYYDSREMLMAVGGIESRKAGHDAIVMLDKADPSGSEFVALTDKILSGASPTAKPLGADVFRTQPASSLLLQPQLRESVVKQVVDATKLSIDATQLDKSKRLFRNIADFLKTGELVVDDIPKIIKAEGISPEQFADIWTETISRAGRELNYLSRLSKDLGVVFRDNQLAASALEKHYNKYKEGQELWERALDGFARMEDFRRGMLVTQLATAMRNMSSQAGRLVLAQFDEALQSTITGGLKAVGLADEATNGINVFNSLYSRLSPRGRTELSRILDSDKAAMHKARMLTQSVHEVPSGTGSLPDTVLSRAAHMGQRLSYVLNTVNRGQEHFFRKIAFEAKLKQRIKDLGKDYRTVDPSEIPEGVYREAVDYALEMTFSASPTSKTGREFLDAYRKLGLTTVNPFPRFAFANALPFVFNHSPLGYLGAMSPKTIKALQSGNPAQFSKAVSRATLGTLMLKSAWHFRQSEYAGEKWYQIKISEDQRTREAKYIDIRAFAPFSSYFFLAEAMLRPERMTNKDYIEAAIGLNRTAGTGLVFVDLLRAKKPETTAKLLENFVGEYVGSFTVPLRTPKDIISHWDKKEATFRDAKNDPTWGPLGRAMTNVPGLGRRFPESASPLSTRERVAETPLLRQFTGLSVTTRNAVEREVDRLGVGWESIYPRTRVEDADRQITRYMAPLMERFGSVLMGHPSYKHASEPRQRIMFKALLKSVRSTATEYYKMKNPDKAGRIWYESLGDDEKKVLGEVLGSNSPLINGLTGRKNN